MSEPHTAVVKIAVIVLAVIGGLVMLAAASVALMAGTTMSGLGC